MEIIAVFILSKYKITTPPFQSSPQLSRGLQAAISSPSFESVALQQNLRFYEQNISFIYNPDPDLIHHRMVLVTISSSTPIRATPLAIPADFEYNGNDISNNLWQYSNQSYSISYSS